MLGRSANRKLHLVFHKVWRKVNLFKHALDMLLMLPGIPVLYFFTCISHAFFSTVFVFHATEDVFIIFKQNMLESELGNDKKNAHIYWKNLRW